MSVQQIGRKVRELRVLVDLGREEFEGPEDLDGRPKAKRRWKKNTARQLRRAAKSQQRLRSESVDAWARRLAADLAEWTD